MQAAGQYGEVPQYVASRVGASHGHMFNLSHEMSLSTTPSAQVQATGTAALGHGHGTAALGHGHGHAGHGLSLSHAPAPQAQASQQPPMPPAATQILSTPSQPSFLQSDKNSQSHHHHHQQQQQQQQQQVQQVQQVQHGFNMNMADITAKTTSSTGPYARQYSQQAVQSAAQQLQADIKQHQQQVHPHTPHTQQQQAIGEHEQQKNPPQGAGIADQANDQRSHQQQSGNLQGSAPASDIGSLSQHALINAGGSKGLGITREESLDGDEQDDEGEKGSGGNRWPRQEALALLKIRSDMDAAFRDSSIKGPLWEEISRKLVEMGYHRSAKKCKEKFENVHKYYKRTKEGKTGRQDGKSYRFFSQLEALYGKSGDSSTPLINLSTKTLTNSSHINISSSNNNNNHNPSNAGINNINGNNTGLLSLNHGGIGSAAGLGSINPANGVTFSSPFPLSFNPASSAAATNAHIARTLDRVESIKHEPDTSGTLHFFIETSEDEDDDDEDDYDEPAARNSGALPTLPTQTSPNSRKRKRKPMKKYLAFFEKVMKKVLDKQEHMQQKFLEALERRDQDRMIREEAWKRQEMARLNREHDVRAAERALSASREASLVAFLQKMTGQNIPLPHTTASMAIQPTNQHCTALVPADYMQNEYGNTDKDPYDPSNKRWPKPEVLALIKLRTSLDRRFHEPGSKAVLWDEISTAMTAQGFARTSKRCKEKWENINKYFKKAKESNKKRPENAKTCPYFHHLNALYKEGLLLGGGGGGSSMSSKHLMVTEKGEEQSGDVTPDQQGNNGGDSAQGQEEDSDALPIIAGEVEGPGSTTIITPANMGAMASPNLAVETGTTSIDAKMHMFMGSVGSERDGSIKKVNEGGISLGMDSSVGAMSNHAALSATASLASGFPKQQEQSQA